MSFYSDKKYDVIERHWFGLPKHLGGSAAAGFTFNETQAALIKRYYPKGPIRLLKIGVLTVATLGKGEQLVGLTVDGTATVKATIVASSASGAFTIASKTLATVVQAGSYLSLLASTNVCSTGSIAVFIDFRRFYNTKWDPSS